MRARLLAVMGMAATVTWPPAASAVSSQVVHAEGAFVAHASTYDIPFPDGNRQFDVMLVVPGRVTASTAPTGPADLAKPWAVVKETALSDGREVCSTVTNVDRWNPGAVTGDGMRWVGTWVDVRCHDGTGYAFYRVHWSPGPFWLATHPVATALMGGQVATWSTARMQGAVQMRPTANSPSVVTGCGHRTDGAARCFAHSTGYGSVLPSAEGVVATSSVIP